MINPELEKKVLAMIVAGKGSKEISEKHGLTRNMVCQIGSHYGVTVQPAPRTNNKPINKEEIARLKSIQNDPFNLPKKAQEQ